MAERLKFKHTQGVAWTGSLEAAIDAAKQEALSHYNSIENNASVEGDAEVQVVVQIRGTYEPDETRLENYRLREQIEQLKAAASEPTPAQ